MGLFSRHRSSSTTQPPPNHNVYVFIRTPDITSTSTTWSLAVSQKPRAQSFPPPQLQDPRLNRKKSFLSFGTNRRQSKAIQTSYSEPQSPTFIPEPSGDLVEFNLVSGDLHVTTHKSQHRFIDTIISEDDEPENPDSVLLKILLPTSTSPHHSSLPLPLQIEQALHRLSSYTAQHISRSHQSQTSPTESWLKLALTALQHERYLPPATSGFNVERFMDFARNSLTTFEGDLLQSQSSEEGRAALAAAAMGFGRSEELDLAKHVKVVDYAKHVAEEERVARLFGLVDERLARTARMQRRKERDATTVGGEGKREREVMGVGVEGVDGNGWVIGRPEMRREWEEGGEVWDVGFERPVNPYAGFV